MDSKWGGKTETINMQLNVEQVCENLMMYYHIKDLAICQLLIKNTYKYQKLLMIHVYMLLPYSLSMVMISSSFMYLPYFQVILSYFTIKLTE